jgi:hypothetical protein
MATNAERADAQLEEVARYRVIHRLGGGTTLLLSFRNSEQVELVSQEQADFILGLLGKARPLNYDRVQQELRVENIPPAFWPLFAPSVDYWLGNEQKTSSQPLLSEDLPGLHAYLKCGERILESRIKPGSQEIYYPVIAAVTAPALIFVPPAFFGAYSKNWPLPRSMVRAPSPTLKIVFSPRRVIV